MSIGHEVPEVFDVIERSAEAGERWIQRFSPQVQAQLMIGAGMLLTAIAWVLSPYVQKILAVESRLLIALAFSPVVLGPSLLVYGLLRAFLPAVPTPAPGSHFGTMLVAADAEQRWKQRMVAIMIAIAHGMAYFAVN